MTEPVYRAHLTPWEGPLWELTVHQAISSSESDLAEWWEADPEQEPVLTEDTAVPSTSPAEAACRAAVELLRAEGWHLWGDWQAEDAEWTVHVGREARSFAPDPFAGVPQPPLPPIPQGPRSEPKSLWRQRLEDRDPQPRTPRTAGTQEGDAS